MTNKMNIAGEGTEKHYSLKKNLSKRARLGKLETTKTKCKFCNHNKLFIGNNTTVKGQGIIKCCKCKRYQNE